MKKEARAKLARELIKDVAAGWNDSAEAFKSIEDGRVTFTITIKGEKGVSVFRYDPQDAVEQIIEGIDKQISGTHVSPSSKASTLRINSLSRVRALINMAPAYFADTISFLPGLASTVQSSAVLRMFGDEKTREKIIEHSADGIKKNIKKQLGALTSRAPELNALALQGTLIELRAELGRKPSQVKIAMRLNKTTKTLRNYSMKLGYESFDAFLDAFYANRDKAGGT
jgi:hypothetical protein